MYCSKCGKEVPEQAKFCNYCGNPLQQNIMDTENKANEIEKTTFMLMQLAAVALAAAFLWFLFKPVVWMGPDWSTDLKKVNLNIIQFTQYCFTEIMPYDFGNRQGAAAVSILMYMISMCFLVLEIIMILNFVCELIKFQKFRNDFLGKILISEIARAVLLVWSILFFGEECYDDFYPYYAVYFKAAAAIILLYVLHSVYFKNRENVD